MTGIVLNKDEFLEKLTYAFRFTSSKVTSIGSIQGILIEIKKNTLHLYSTNLSFYFHSFIKTETEQNQSFIIEPKNIIDFLSLLPAGRIELETKEKKVIIKQNNRKGEFSLIEEQDFPRPPKIEEKQQTLKTEFLIKNLPLILFSASNDMARPVLTGVNFLVENDQILMVSTDGFRLSLLKIKKEIDIPSFIVPASFLEEILNFIKKEKEVKFFYSAEEKMIKFQINDLEFYSRLIEGDFPPFEKVIPQKAPITVEVEKDEFLRNIKLVAIFAREYSNVVILKIKKDKIIFQPKADSEEKEIAIQEAKIIGEEEIKVAFNYKFLLDLLNHLQGKDLLIELVRKDAPVVFKIKNNPDFLHIIMPVRTQE